MKLTWELFLALLPFLLTLKVLSYFGFLMRADSGFDSFWLQRLGANLRGISLVITIVGLARIASGFGQGQTRMAALLAEALTPTAVGFSLALVADFMADIAEKRRSSSAPASIVVPEIDDRPLATAPKDESHQNPLGLSASRPDPQNATTVTLTLEEVCDEFRAN